MGVNLNFGQKCNLWDETELCLEKPIGLEFEESQILLTIKVYDDEVYGRFQQ